MGKTINQFSPQTLQEIGYYVYLLVDPRDNTIFYVGKGENNRVFNHEEKVRKDFNPDNDKEVRIKDILDAGLNVEKYIVRYQLTEEQAFIVESVLINLLGGGKGEYVPFKFELSNIQGGHQMSTNKIMTVEQLDALYSSKPLTVDEITDRVMCININKAYRRDGDVYEAVRAAWRISQKKPTNVIMFLPSTRIWSAASSRLTRKVGILLMMAKGSSLMAMRSPIQQFLNAI